MPLAMAFAIASGAKPEQGLYTAIVAGVVLPVRRHPRADRGADRRVCRHTAGITAQYGSAVFRSRR